MPHSGSKLNNREISWLAFNERVLQEAEDTSVPLIERLKFLGIFSSNLDEFFRVRVATVKRMLNIGNHAYEFINEKPKKLLKTIYNEVVDQQERFGRAYQDIVDQLEKESIYIVNETQLSAEQKRIVKDYFLSKVRPTLVPIMLYKHGDFPYLKERSIYLAIQFIKNEKALNSPYSLIEIPTEDLPRFLILPKQNNKDYVILLDDIIRVCLPQIFSVFNFSDFNAYTIKLTRDAELDIDKNDLSKSVIEKVSKSIKQRKKAEPVRFIYHDEMPKSLLRFIVKSMKLDNEDNLIPGSRYHNFKDFIKFPDFGRKNLRYKKESCLPHPLLKPEEGILKVIKKKEILLHFPYHSFNHIIDTLREAAIDPKVTSIKMTVYRLAEKSNVMNAIINAAKNGKDVTVVVELQARFDEENNIFWANRLQEEGVKVIFGIPGLKVHSKLILISRQEYKGIGYYAALGTGNFNEVTSELYCDHILLTAEKRITKEVFRLFNFMENNYKSSMYHHLLVSPFSMRKKYIKLINQEIKNAKAGKAAYILLKMNSLVDSQMIEKLYEASNNGVKIRIIVRGICCLKSGVEQVSENIEAISIVDRYLEHSRIFIFCSGGNEDVYISSADWMTRNLDHRIEVSCPVYDKSLKAELKALFELQWRDNTKARIIDRKLSNSYKQSSENTKIRSQLDFYKVLKVETTAQK